MLTSATSSLPELTGADGAHVVDPYDVGAITRGIRDLDSSGDLRDGLVRNGHVRAEMFSNEKYEARLRELYRRCI